MLGLGLRLNHLYVVPDGHFPEIAGSGQGLVLGFRVSGFGFRVSAFRFRVGFSVWS